VAVTRAPHHPPPHRLPTADWFVERAKESGLDFTHFNGMSGEQYYPEIMAPGVGCSTTTTTATSTCT
jgi:hypothetical protein